MATFTKSVVVSGDDGSWIPALDVFDTVNDVAVGKPSAAGGGSSSHFYLRITNVTIDQGDTVDTSVINVVPVIDVAGTVTNAIIAAANVDNPAAPTSATEAEGLTLTTAQVPWTIGDVTGGVGIATPSITSIIQERISDPTWTNGDSILLVVRDNGTANGTHRSFASFDHSTLAAPQLDITYTPAGGGTTPVESDRSISYGVNVAIQSDRAISYGVNTTATSERAASWDVLASVTANRDVLYSVRDAILSDRALNYDVLGGVQSDRAVAWDVLAPLSVDRALSYSIAATVTADRELIYSIRAGVTSERQILYAIDQIGLSAVTSDRALSWGVLASLNSDRDLIYSTLASLSSERGIVYDVLVSITSDRAATWALLEDVSSDREMVYAIGGGVTSDRVLLWSVDTTGTPRVIDLSGSYEPIIAASGSYQRVVSVNGADSRVVMVVGSIAEMPYLAEIGSLGRYDEARYGVSVYGP